MLLRLKIEAERLQELDIAPRTDLTLYQTHKLLMRFMMEATDAGNTPQIIISSVLSEIHGNANLQVHYSGRACETNLTAKKPADILIETLDGKICHLYEITVKPIDRNRIEDSIASVLAHGRGYNEVVWLCRIPEDIKPLRIDVCQSIDERGVRCEFVDISLWLLQAIEIIGAEGRQRALDTIGLYVSQPQTSETVKSKWMQLHKE
jgi:hypothetical protein